jgi:hypothetical protein
MNNLLIERLQYYKTERTRIRKKLFKQLRQHKHLIKDGWLLRKMKLNYLGDLTDDQLIGRIKDLEKAKGESEDAIY